MAADCICLKKDKRKPRYPKLIFPHRRQHTEVVKSIESKSKAACVQILLSLFISSVTLGKLLNHSVPSIFIHKMGILIIIIHHKVIVRIKWIYIKHLYDYLAHNAIYTLAITTTVTTIIAIPSWIFESREVIPVLLWYSYNLARRNAISYTSGNATTDSFTVIHRYSKNWDSQKEVKTTHTNEKM